MITIDSEGLIPLDIQVDFTGKTLVLNKSKLGSRFQLSKFQIVKIDGGFGCKPDSLGGKVFGTHLGDNESTAYRRGDFIGEASPTLIEKALGDPHGELPVDPSARHFMAIGGGGWGTGETIEEAQRSCKQAGGTASVVFDCHKETRISDMAMVWPNGVGEPVTVWEKPQTTKKMKQT